MTQSWKHVVAIRAEERKVREEAAVVAVVVDVVVSSCYAALLDAILFSLAIVCLYS